MNTTATSEPTAAAEDGKSQEGKERKPEDDAPVSADDPPSTRH